MVVASWVISAAVFWDSLRWGFVRWVVAGGAGRIFMVRSVMVIPAAVNADFMLGVRWRISFPQDADSVNTTKRPEAKSSGWQWSAASPVCCRHACASCCCASSPAGRSPAGNALGNHFASGWNSFIANIITVSMRPRRRAIKWCQLARDSRSDYFVVTLCVNEIYRSRMTAEGVDRPPNSPATLA